MSGLTGGKSITSVVSGTVVKPLLRCCILAAVLVLSGCATRVNDIMNSWMGHNVSEVVANWGPPAQVMEIGGGNRLFVWTAVREWTTPGTATTTTNVYGTPGFATAYSTTNYTPPQTSGYNATRTFWVNSDGEIYQWAWRGL
jgi:hypothetical protein